LLVLHYIVLQKHYAGWGLMLSFHLNVSETSGYRVAPQPIE